MFGGKLNLENIKVLKNHILTAFDRQFYLFSKATQQIISKYNAHDTSIVSFSVQEVNSSYQISSLGEDGLNIETKLQVGSKSNQQGETGEIVWEFKSKKSTMPKNQKKRISSAIFVSHQAYITLDDSKKLSLINSQKGSFTHIYFQCTFSGLKSNSEDSRIYAIFEEQTKVRIFEKAQIKNSKDYEHNCRIKSVTSHNNSLIIGDENGKITILHQFLSASNKKSRTLNSVLEWHTGPVLCLHCNGQYLYSAGQESVVVLWHLRDLSRDFLPRVRTNILSLYVSSQTNQIVCGLSDNTIKIIDLGRDKQTQSYKVVVNPQGYAPDNAKKFSQSTTSQNNGVICLNGLPGKLQFINLNKNGENSQLEIVPRNLISGLNNDSLQPHRVNVFSFSQDASVLVVSVKTVENKCYLKFYRKGVEGYELINKVNNPHEGPVENILTVGKGRHVQFITFSKSDEVTRVWSETRSKKKSIIDVEQVFWRCSSQLKFRNLLPIFISTNHNNLLISYKSVNVLHSFSENGQCSQINTFNFGDDVSEINIIGASGVQQKLSLTFVVWRNNGEVEIWTGAISKKQNQLKFKNLSRIRVKCENKFLVFNQKSHEVAIIFSSEKKSKIFIWNQKQHKYTQTYQVDTEIQSALYLNNQLILIDGLLTLSSLDGKQFVTFSQGDSSKDTQIEQEEIQVRNGGILKMAHRWVQRESLRNKQKIEDGIEGLHLLPNCSYAWQQMADRLLI